MKVDLVDLKVEGVIVAGSRPFHTHLSLLGLASVYSSLQILCASATIQGGEAEARATNWWTIRCRVYKLLR